MPAAETASREFVDSAMESPELLDLASGASAVFSTRCPGNKAVNEDSATVIPISKSSAIIAIADGMGGCPAGDEASRLTIALLQEMAQDSEDDDGSLRAVILDAFEAANTAVRELGVGAGTTLAVVEIHEDAVRAYHVGDSMAYVIGGRGKIKHHTIAHSPIGYGVESGLLDRAGAIHHADRYLVSNYIGSESMHIQIGPIVSLSARDTVLVASDGLVDNLHADEIAAAISQGSLESAAQQLAQQALQRMIAPARNEPSKPDDLSFIAYRQG